MGVDLCGDVRRRIDQGPGALGAAGNGDGGLGTRAGCESPATHAGAVPAVAIPLWEPAAGGGSQHSNLQGSAGAARLRGLAPGLLQRLAMYIVISMPKRKSIACGVSHFMTLLLQSGLLTTAPICRQ